MVNRRLRGAASFDLQGDTLMLKDASGAVALVFERV
jgi:hypothetical protein